MRSPRRSQRREAERLLARRQTQDLPQREAPPARRMLSRRRVFSVEPLWNGGESLPAPSLGGRFSEPLWVAAGPPEGSREALVTRGAQKAWGGSRACRAAGCQPGLPDCGLFRRDPERLPLPFGVCARAAWERGEAGLSFRAADAPAGVLPGRSPCLSPGARRCGLPASVATWGERSPLGCAAASAVACQWPRIVAWRGTEADPAKERLVAADMLVLRLLARMWPCRFSVCVASGRIA